MTRQEKLRFMRNLTDAVLRDALAKVPQMPEEWDGHELRRYLADQFEWEASSLRRSRRPGLPAPDRRRIRAYEREVLSRNLR